MGCGKSKQSVATENTITLKKLTSQVKNLKENNNEESYYSPRKDDEIDSEYFSPRLGSAKTPSSFGNSVKFDDDNVKEISTDPVSQNEQNPKTKEESSMSMETLEGANLESSENKMEKSNEEK